MKGRAALKHFDLSQNKSLRTLEITAQSITSLHSPPEDGFLRASDFLKAALSSITFPGLLEVVVIYRDIVPVFHPVFHQFRTGCKQGADCTRHYWQEELVMDEHDFHHQLRVIREMYKVRDFRLVLCLDALDCLMDVSRELMKKTVKAVRRKGGFDFLSCEPLVVCERRVLRSRATDNTLGVWKPWMISCSCL